MPAVLPAPHPVRLAESTRAAAPETPAIERRARPSAPPQTIEEDQSPLGPEVIALTGVMSAADAKQWPEAMRALDAYDRSFPNGLMRTEADVVRVTVLCGLSQTDEARSLARDLERRDSTNPAVDRLRLTCAAPASQP